MTKEEKQKAIDALKISAPVIAVTQEEFNDYIQILNKIMDWLEQEPCEDAISRQAVLDIVDSYSESQSNVEDVTQDIISDIVALPSVNPQPCEELDFVQPHKKFPVNLEACKMREATQEEREGIEQYIDSISIAESCEDAISREDALMCLTGEIKETDTIETIIARSGRRIRKLPPVKQAKTGYWIEHEIKDTCRWLTCSACGYEWVHKKENFCPNCGACMKDCRTLDEFIEDSKESEG